MELTLRHWILVTATLCGALAVYLLPPDPERHIRVRNEQPVTPERRVAQRYSRLVDQTESLLWTRQQFARIERAAVRSDATLLLDLNPEFDPEITATIRSSAAASLDSLGPVFDRSRAGISTMQARPRIGNRILRQAVDYFEFDSGGFHHCFAVYPWEDNTWLRPRRTYGRNPGELREAAPPSPLGACWLPLRYGAAGPAISAWFQNHGASFAQPTWAGFGRQFGPSYYSFFLDREERGCLAGRKEVCADQFRGGALGQPMSRKRGLGGSSFPGHSRVFAGMERMFTPDSHDALRDLETQFGRDRFSEFWTSEESLDDAFMAAFGVEMGEWVYQWATSRWGRAHRGPRMSISTYLWILAVVGLAVAWTVYRERNRTVTA